MKKAMGRKLKKTIVLVVVVAIFFVAIWALSHMGGILNWLMKNWLPFLVGFIVAVIGNAVVEIFFKDEEGEDQVIE